MQQLDPADYARAQDVLQALDQHLTVEAILAGDVPEARVLVDDPARPAVALAWSKDHLRSEMCSERASVEDFVAKNFGICLVYADEIVSWCLSEYNLGPRCEVGIETVAAYRRRGLGTLVARALVEHALAHGYSQIGWDCWADNRPSAATAQKAGFRKVSDYPVYFARHEAAPDPAP
jgi:RimJ/RimL family protein N-acetyltransferase